MTSWRAEVLADGSGKWVGNSLRFATRDEAEAYAIDLGVRWTSVREARAVESFEPVNYRWADDRLTRINKISSEG